MESLKRLEQVQNMMMFIQSHNLVSFPSSTLSSSDSLRFLSHFLLFLMEPCGQLRVDDKCRLISQHLPLISQPSFLEKALEVLPEKGTGPMNDLPPVDEVQCHRLEVNFMNQDVALIGFDAMQRANSTLEDFCRSYFMFHGMDVKRPESVFKYLPVLSFTESYIYQLDSLNEKMVNVVGSTTSILVDKSGEKSNSTREYSFLKTFGADPFQPLSILIECHGLLTERVKDELKHGEEYWSLERKLCNALDQQVEILVEDVMRAIHLKSFDYRVLNLLLYQLRGQEVFFLVLLDTFFTLDVNDLHMEFLSVSEFLVEISDDLFDYEEDVLENNFNILRMFVRIYGASAAPALLAKCIAEAEEKYEELSKALDSELSLSYRRRCEEATREGGKVSGHPLGSWTIPPLIVDEELYRSTLQNSP